MTYPPPGPQPQPGQFGPQPGYPGGAGYPGTPPGAGYPGPQPAPGYPPPPAGYPPQGAAPGYPPPGVPGQPMPGGPGQPPPGGPGYPPPGGGVPGMPPPNPKKGVGRVASGAMGCLTLLIVGGFFLGLRIWSHTPSTYEAGQCLGDEKGNGKIFEAECGSEESSYRIEGVLDRELTNTEYQDISAEECPGNLMFTQGGKTYCSVLDVEVGDCVAGNTSETSVPYKAQCGGVSEPVTTVEHVVDPSLCGDDPNRARVSEKPPLTICIGN